MKKRKVFHQKDILDGNIAETMLMLLFPIFLGYLLQQLYGFVDNIVLGRLISKQALAAVGGSATSLINILLNFVGGITSAITVMVAQNYGRGNMEKVRTSVRTGISVSIALGLGLSLILIGVSSSWLKMMNEPAETMSLSLTYMYFYFSSLVFYFVYQTGICIFRALGDSRRPLLLIGVAAATKILLDLLFAGIFRMGVFGTSMATLLSHMICAAVVLFIFEKTHEVYQFSIRSIGFDKEESRTIFAIGLPFAIQSMMFAIPNAVIQFRINSFSTDAIAAYSAYSSVDALFWCFSNALNAAAITMASQNFGRGNIARVRKIVTVSIVIDFVAGIAFGALFYGFGKTILSLFLKDEVPLAIAEGMIRAISLSYVFFSPIDPLSAVFKSCGMTKAPLIIAVFTICIVRIAYIVLYPISEPVQVIIAFPLSWIATSIAYFICYRIRKDIFRKDLI